MDKMPRGTNGRRLCRECQTEVTPPRLTFCSKDCVDAYQIRTNGGFLRSKVFKRDKGVCAVCLLDTCSEYADWIGRKHDLTVPYQGAKTDIILARERYINLTWQKYGSLMGFMRSGHKGSWDADHIVPVCEGGGECSLSNLRTLCIPCHKAVTAELAARRAKPKPVKPEPEPSPQLALLEAT